MFHRVIVENEEYFIPPMSVSYSIFSFLMEKLAKSRQIVSLEKALEKMQCGTLKGRCVAITFDDGYRDNYEIAMNLLKSKGIPADFFIPVSPIDRGYPYWWDYLDSVIRKNKILFLKWLRMSRFEGIAELSDLKDRQMPVSRLIVRYLNTAGKYLCADFLNAVQTEFGPYGGKRLLMNWEELRCLHKCGFTVGSHALSHTPLTDLPLWEAKREISESGKILSQKLGTAVKGFSYPRGAWNREIVSMVRQAGYDYAVSTVFGSNRPGCNIYTLSRRGISDYPDIRSFFPVPMYLLEMTGLLDRLIAKRR
jgi:peptidoglycan/xylan/chitin deacetylase (PgdA/CDA1 family)